MPETARSRIFPQSPNPETEITPVTNPRKESMATENKTRWVELDVFRGLAALYVLCFHYTIAYAELSGSQPFFHLKTGIFGVQLFFIISGFVIIMTLERSQRPMDFIVSRFSRLYPGYWAAVLLTFVLVKIFHLLDRDFSMRRVIANLSMFQDWIGINHVDGVYWTLSIELAFYFAMLLLFVTKALKYIETFGLVWIILMACAASSNAPPRVYMDIAHLLKFGNLFFAGILFYNLKTKGTTWYRMACLALCLLVQGVVKVDIHNSQILDPIIGMGVVLGFFTLFYVFIKGKLTFIGLKPLIFLGTISYSLYLTHQNVGFAAINYLHQHSANAFVSFIVPLVCALLIATCITFCIEQPAMNYIRNKYKKSRHNSKSTI